MLVTAVLFGGAAVRDVHQVEMDPLLFTSPAGKAEFLGGRLEVTVVRGDTGFRCATT